MTRHPYVAFLRVTVEKRVALLRRYLVNSVFQMVAFLFVFGLVFFGGRRIAPTVLEDSLSGLVVGFFIWTTAARAYSETSRQIETEATWGTLEQLYMSPFGIERVVLANSVVTLAGSLGFGGVVLGVVLLATDTGLTAPPGIVPLGLLTIAPVIGLGLGLGGLTLVYKRVEAITGLMQLFLVAFLSLPLDASPLVAALPLTLGTRLVETTMRAGSITAVAPTLLAVLVAKTLVYLLVGFGGLHYLQRIARRRGLLGQY
jgi:ABC-2 type transport system permease protein